MKDYLLQRAKEASTWRGLVLLVTAAGVGITPELANAIITAGVSLAGLLGIFSKG
jgi:hypothetical protein